MYEKEAISQTVNQTARKEQSWSLQQASTEEILGFSETQINSEDSNLNQPPPTRPHLSSPLPPNITKMRTKLPAQNLGRQIISKPIW